VSNESSWPDIAFGFDGGGGLDALVGGPESFWGGAGLDFSLKLLNRAIASGVEVSSLAAGTESLELWDRWSACRFASASGVDGATAGFSRRLGASPEAALACMAAFCFTKLSFNSSTRSRFAGPPVRLKPALPRRMLSLRTSGTTIFSVCALFSLPKAFLNSGSVLPLLSLCTWRDLRLALKSNLPGWGAGDWALSIGVLIEVAGDGELGFGSISGLSLLRATGFAAGSGGGDFSLMEAGGDLGGLTGAGDSGLTRAGVSTLVTRDETSGLIGSDKVLVSSCFVGELLRDSRFLFSSVIHDGCVETGVGFVGFSSDLVNADSSQLDLVGLHLLVGLDGDDASAEPWLRADIEATDLERL
jgi:hypothetical protein